MVKLTSKCLKQGCVDEQSCPACGCKDHTMFFNPEKYMYGFIYLLCTKCTLEVSFNPPKYISELQYSKYAKEIAAKINRGEIEV